MINWNIDLTASTKTNNQLPVIYEIDPVTATSKRSLKVEADYITGFRKLIEE